MEQVVTLLCVFGLGMCFSLLGSISVKLMPRLKIDTAKFGTLISSFMITCLVASVVVGVLIDIWGHKPFAVIGFIVTAFCIFIIARATSYGAVLAACLLLGVGAMCLNNVGNTLMPHVLFGGQNAPAALNLGNVFFGLGLFLTPFIVSFLFRKVSYENAVSVLALIALVPVIFAMLAKYPDVKLGFEMATAAKLLVNPVVIVAALALFCYISLEMSFSNWLPSFGKEVISSVKPDADAGVIDASSQRMLSAFAVAMMVGRLITSQIPSIAEYGSYFIAGAALLSCLAILVMTAVRNVSLAWLMAILAGLFFAPCFPTTVGVTFNKQAENQGTVFGIIFAVGLLGGVIIPKAIGNLAKGSSIQKSLKLLIPACVALIILALVLGRL
jgi:fucose permease